VGGESHSNLRNAAGIEAALREKKKGGVYKNRENHGGGGKELLEREDPLLWKKRHQAVRADNSLIGDYHKRVPSRETEMGDTTNLGGRNTIYKEAAIKHCGAAGSVVCDRDFS